MAEIREGTLVGERYKIKKKIGVGGMSVVYRAIDTQIDRDVAIKFLKDEFIDDQEFVKRFKNEAKATSQLIQANIVRTYDLGDDNGIPFIVMEYVDGLTLKDYIKSMNVIPWRDALKITAQVLAGVDCAHMHKVIHRDIKPQNIMIASGGTVKLADFGIARAVSDTTRSAKSDSTGSVYYISPEQARGGFVDERSDIYSIGVSLYEMVTGILPFKGDNYITIAMQHFNANIQSPHDVNPEIPVGVSDLVMMAMNKQPEYRFQSAKDMFVRLKSVLKNPDEEFIPKEEIAIDATGAEIEVNDAAKAQDVISTEGKDEHISKISDRQRAQTTADIVRLVTIKTAVYIIAIVIAVAASGFAISQFVKIGDKIGNFTEVSYKLSDYTGMNADIVQSELESVGFRVSKIPVESEKMGIGYIVSQSQPSGTVLSTKEDISIYVSSATGAFTMDDYSGQNYRSAGAKLVALGVNVKYSAVSSSFYDEQMVVRTSPEEGNIVSPGDTVTVFYSTGAPMTYVTVPDLSNMTLRQAEMQLKALGLKLGNVFPEPGSDISAYVTPSPTGTPEPTSEPSPTGTPDEEQNTGKPKKTETFEPSATPNPTEPGESPEPTGSLLPTVNPSQTAEPSPTLPYPTASLKVVSQYPKAGTMIYKNEYVDVYFIDEELLEKKIACSFDFPSDVVTKETAEIRIESIALDKVNDKTAISSILYNNSKTSEEDCPIAYTVTIPANRIPQQVTIYVNGKIYKQMVVYGK